jgi:hypothetical protein
VVIEYLFEDWTNRNRTATEPHLPQPNRNQQPQPNRTYRNRLPSNMEKSRHLEVGPLSKTLAELGS